MQQHNPKDCSLEKRNLTTAHHQTRSVAVRLKYHYIIWQYNVPYLRDILLSFLEVAIGGKTFAGREQL
jgi:hypothetical protein